MSEYGNPHYHTRSTLKLYSYLHSLSTFFRILYQTHSPIYTTSPLSQPLVLYHLQITAIMEAIDAEIGPLLTMGFQNFVEVLIKFTQLKKIVQVFGTFNSILVYYVLAHSMGQIIICIINVNMLSFEICSS